MHGPALQRINGADKKKSQEEDQTYKLLTFQPKRLFLGHDNAELEIK